MEEIEVPLEQAQEETMHHALHGGHEAASQWTMKVALSSALLAVLAAISALLAGHHSNEAMLEQIHASDQWGYYQAKGLKGAVLGSKIDLLDSLGHPASDEDRAKAGEYKKQQEEISEKAKELEESSRKHLEHHVALARAVTLFQVAIGIGAIAVLVRKRRFWFVSLCFGGIGAVCLILALLGGAAK